MYLHHPQISKSIQIIKKGEIGKIKKIIASFGYKVGLATVSLYLLEGIVGLPVFSNSPEKGVGLVYFTGPTMGYLLGFLSASF